MRFIIIMLWDLINRTEFKHLMFSLAQVSPCKNSHSGHALKLFVWEVWCKPLEGNQEPWRKTQTTGVGGRGFPEEVSQFQGRRVAESKNISARTGTHHCPESIVHLRKMLGFHLQVSSLCPSSRFLICTECHQTCVCILESVLIWPLKNTLPTFVSGSTSNSKWPQRRNLFSRE